MKTRTIASLDGANFCAPVLRLAAVNLAAAADTTVNVGALFHRSGSMPTEDALFGNGDNQPNGSTNQTADLFKVNKPCEAKAWTLASWTALTGRGGFSRRCQKKGHVLEELCPPAPQGRPTVMIATMGSSAKE